MRLLTTYKLLLVIATSLLGGAIAGMTLGGFAVGDAFSFYRNRESFASRAPFTVASQEEGIDATTSDPPHLTGPASAVADYPSEASWDRDDFQEIDRLYHTASYRQPATAEISGSNYEMGPGDMLPDHSPAAANPDLVDDVDWESVGDTGRMESVALRRQAPGAKEIGSRAGDGASAQEVGGHVIERD